MPVEEWTTVSKKGGYVPPHLRAKLAADAAEAEKKKPLDVKSMTMFPSLGPKKAADSAESKWSGPVSFKEKIDELIAYEARSEIEKEAAEEARRALEGFVRLPLKITPDFIKKYNTTLANAVEREKQEEMCGSVAYWSPASYSYANDPEPVYDSDQD
jgi:hypothetical protein